MNLGDIRRTRSVADQLASLILGHLTANRWHIPYWLEHQVLQRDTSCIYCGIVFGFADAPFGSRPSWEHIANDARIITRENVARCCRSCNASKGVKPLPVWLASAYCKQRGITKESVAAVVRSALERGSNAYAAHTGVTEYPSTRSLDPPPRFASVPDYGY
jgi:hypothetical protein